MLNILAVFLGGGIGSVLRWLVCKLISSHFGTFSVNILGAFFIGVLYQYIAQRTNFSPHLKLFLMTGLLGGFTTFSTYLLDFTKLLNTNSFLEAFIYLSASLLIGTAFLFSGIKLANMLG